MVVNLSCKKKEKNRHWYFLFVVKIESCFGFLRKGSQIVFIIML